MSTYIWTVLHSRNLFVDYVRWKRGEPGKIPKVLQDAPEIEQKVFVFMRMRKSIEQIASRLKVSVEEATELANSVLEKLIKAGLQDMVLTPVEVELKEDVIDTRPLQAKSSMEDRILLYRVCAEYRNAVNELHPEEQVLLRLFYNEELKAEEILENYRIVKKNLPGGRKPEELRVEGVYKIIDKAKRKLLKLLQEKCEHLKEVNVASETVNTFLDQLGVQFNGF